ncbi:MAG: DUF1559 domain-containing protein [Capsulimonadaceae bacterium]|nr:DUF1559 domain-containing protein [Capsulimonadaceae bacterium]
MYRTNRQSGFTLIELLVVIAIIAILAAILFPVFATAREKARQTACISNCKQIAIAFIQYSQDFDESFPVGTTNSNCVVAGSTIVSGDCRQGNGWTALVYPYLKSKQVFLCPSDSAQAYSSGGTTYDQLSYSYNANVAQVYTGGSWPAGYVGNQLSAFTNPDRTVLVFEITIPQSDALALQLTSLNGCSPVSNGVENGCNMQMATGYMGGSTTPGGLPTCPTQPNSCYLPTGRHNAGSNFCLADGHAKWIPGNNVAIGYPFGSPGFTGDFPCSGWCRAAAPSQSRQGSSQTPFTATFATQ